MSHEMTDLFIDRPIVFIIASTRLRPQEVIWAVTGNVDWVPPTKRGYPDGSSLVEVAGRVCYWSFGKGRRSHEDYIMNLISKKHGSVLEHVSYSFFIGGISRACSHEIVRHRAGWAYSQLSTRYVDDSQVRFVIPPTLLLTHDRDRINAFKRQCLEALEEYRQIKQFLQEKFERENVPKTDRRKLINQAARYILPNATETRMVATANLRALRHFFEMRANRHADVEIRRLANYMFSLIRKEEPVVFSDYKTVPLDDGTFEVVTENTKV